MSEFKLVTITWSQEPTYDITRELLYKSFKLNNPDIEIIHHHFNINDYNDLLKTFNERFAVQSDYIFFKIYLLHDLIKKIDSKYIIFCDTTDVTCTSNVQHLSEIFDLENYVIIGQEKNDFPKDFERNTWVNYTDYSGYDLENKTFLNSGVIVSKKENYLNLLEKLIDNVLPLDLKHFRGDQGVYTYYYNTFNKQDNLIRLDYSSLLVVNTYLRLGDDYLSLGNKISSKFNAIKPIFIHDNGYHYGSPKYKEHFKLIDVFTNNNENLETNNNQNMQNFLEVDSQDYHVLSNAVKRVKNVPGIICEIGTRRGGSMKIIIDTLLENNDNDRNIVGIDPYGNIDYQVNEVDKKKIDYTNNMRNQTLSSLYNYVTNKRVNLLMLILEDTEFFEKFKNGIPFYNEEKIILNQYALVYFDGPHSTELIMKEIEFFNERTPIGGYWVFDDVDNGFYPHNEQIEPWLLNNGYKMVEKTRCKASYVKLN